jgi:hypothetical protein
MVTDCNDQDRSLWYAHIRADMLSQSSLALPHRGFWRMTMTNPPWIIRLPDNCELIAQPSVFEAIAEGQLWRDIIDGTRLPAVILADRRADKASFAVGCVEKGLTLQTSPQWREDRTSSTSHWKNEKVAGMQLLYAEERKGKDEYLVLRPIQEITPPGWKRSLQHLNEYLERIED